MLHLPPEFQSTISVFSAVFSPRVWNKALVLLLGAICCPGSRTICNILRASGLGHDKRFHKYHRFLSMNKWSALSLSAILLRGLVNTFVDSHSALVFGLDETIERRWGPKITKRAIYRDAVRSSASHVVKCSGLRWMSLMLLCPLPWLKKGVWALPVLTALCPSQRYWGCRDKPRSHKSLMNWAAQLLSWLARYTKVLNRPVYLVGDGTYATYELMGKAKNVEIGLIVRMRMDARLFHFPTPPAAGRPGPKPKIGSRILGMTKRLTDGRVKWTTCTFTQWYGKKNKKMLITSGKAIWSRNKNQKVELHWVLIKDPEGKMEPALIACSDLATSAVDIVRFFVRRWQVEVTFCEVRRHLGVETQRQWSDLAIERTTPLLMGLKSLICLLALPLYKAGNMTIRTAAWYPKSHFTFSDVHTAVKQQIWAVSKFSTSSSRRKVENLEAKIRYLEALLTEAVA